MHTQKRRRKKQFSDLTIVCPNRFFPPVNLLFRSKAWNMEFLSAVCCILLLWHWHKRRDIRWNISQHFLTCQYSENKNLLASNYLVFVLAEWFFSREVSSKAGRRTKKVGATIKKKKNAWLLSVSCLLTEDATNSYLQLLSGRWISLLLQNGYSHPWPYCVCRQGL